MGSVTFEAAWSLHDVVVAQVAFVHFAFDLLVVAVVVQVVVVECVVVQLVAAALLVVVQFVVAQAVAVGDVVVQVFDAQFFAFQVVVAPLLVVSNDLAPIVAIFAVQFVCPLPSFPGIPQVAFFLLQIVLLWPK